MLNKNSNKSLYIKSCFYNDETIFEGTVLSTATGFFVKNGEEVFLITNRHVVTGKNIFTGKLLDEKNASLPNKLIVEFPYEVKRINSDDNFWANPFEINLYKNNTVIDDEKLWIEHPIYKEKIDIVAINVTVICKNSIDALYNIGNCSFVNIPLYENIDVIDFVPKVTDQVFVVGYPYGYSTTDKRYLPIWSRATIASEYEENLTVPINYIDEWNRLYSDLNLESDEQKKAEIMERIKKVNHYEVPTFLVDARTREGQSGSPVIYCDKTGNEDKTFLLGIYSGRVNENSDLGYVWKTELIKEIIEKVV